MGYGEEEMGIRTIIISAAGFRHDYEAKVYIPDPVGHEPETAYLARVNRYLDQKYGVEKWRIPDSTAASRSMLHTLDVAEATQTLRGQLHRLKRRAARSLTKLDKLTK